VSRVQRTPRGLTSLLGIVGEQPPQLLADAYAPIVETRDLIVQELQPLQATSNDPAAVPGAGPSALVPPNEQHFLIAAEAVVTIPAGPPTFIGVQLRLQTNAGSVVAYASRSSADGPLTVGRQVVCFFVPPQFMMLSPGHGFRAVLDELTGAAAASVTVVYLYRRVLV
jgi:hypothetical protein